MIPRLFSQAVELFIADKKSLSTADMGRAPSRAPSHVSAAFGRGSHMMDLTHGGQVPGESSWISGKGIATIGCRVAPSLPLQGASKRFCT